MAKFDTYFALAEKEGLEALELYVDRSYSVNVSLFQGQVENNTISDSSQLSARGIYQGKIGYAKTEKFDKNTPEFIVGAVKVGATFVDKDDPAIIFKGSDKYQKKNTYHPELKEIPLDRKIAVLFEIERKLKAYDPRIIEIQGCEYTESESEVNLVNSYGLSLKSKSNYFYYYAGVVVKEGNDVKSGYKIGLHSDFGEFDVDKFVREAADDALSKLGGTPVPSKDYPIILNQKIAANLLSAFLDSVSSEEVQKKSSLLAGKINETVAGKKLTVLEEPLTKNFFFRYFDDEGVATYNKTIIEKGVLKTYLYNLLTAKKDGVTTTGNGYGSSIIGIGFVNVRVKPGKLSREQLMKKMGNGLLITDLQGLHAGMNPQSGNFSLQASGFLVENGVIVRPVNLITVAGNLFELFKDVTEVGSDLELQLSSFNVPSLLIKKLSVAG